MKSISSMGGLAIGVLAVLLDVATATHISASQCPGNTSMVPQELEAHINKQSILEHILELRKITRRPDSMDRVAGSKGSNDTLKYIEDQLTGAGYDVEVQPFSREIQVSGKALLRVGNASLDATQVLWSPNIQSTNLTVIPVQNTGCAIEDYAPAVGGQIALAPGGGCSLSNKSSVAKGAGAAALVVYESMELQPSLDGEKDSHVATVKISEKNGLRLMGAHSNGVALQGSIASFSRLETVYSSNIIATLPCVVEDGNTLMVGAHSDTVTGSPGMNDNGSGIAALLEVALRLSRYRTARTVKFAFWTAGESGHLGARDYVGSAAGGDLDAMRLYLDVRAVASPNGFVQLWDGSDPVSRRPGPAGSSEARGVLRAWYAAQGIPARDAGLGGRSGYGPFLEAGVPCAGIFAGADGLMSPREAELTGGEAGKPYDYYYHTGGDNLLNVDADLLHNNTRAVAHLVARYGIDPVIGSCVGAGQSMLLSHPLLPAVGLG